MPEVDHSGGMLEEAAKDISEYLTTGMHHSTREAQSKITELIQRRLVEEFKQASSPTQFVIDIHQLTPLFVPDFNI